MNDKFGCAFIHIKNNIIYQEMIKLSDNAWVFVAEAIAIDRAVTYLRDKDIFHSRIFTDSRSVLKDVENPFTKNKIILDIREKLSKNIEIELYWIKAYVGIKFNNIVQYLTKEATKLNQIDHNIINFNKTYIKKVCFKAMNDRWQNEWNTSIMGNRIQGNFYILTMVFLGIIKNVSIRKIIFVLVDVVYLIESTYYMIVP